jgi:Sulfotransferase family
VGLEGVAATSSDRSAWERLDELEEYRHLCRGRLGDIVHVYAPLVLVSQIQRSGGTLISQLFDSHPECHAHPFELKFGRKDALRWPSLDLGAPPGKWFKALYERKAAQHLVSGYTKPGLKGPDVEVFPFLFLPRLQKLIFDECIAAQRIDGQRQIYDAYFTSYFNAWLDNQNLYSKPKTIATGFKPRTHLMFSNLERFFEVYPDGTLISIVREPRAWYASAFRHRPQYVNLDKALRLWRRSAEASIEAARRFGVRVIMLTYEQLVLDTEATVRRVADRLGIAMSPHLLRPTFNGRPVRANSSDPVEAYGILPERTEAFREVLDQPLIARIEDLGGDLYRRAEAVASRV